MPDNDVKQIIELLDRIATAVEKIAEANTSPRRRQAEVDAERLGLAALAIGEGCGSISELARRLKISRQSVYASDSIMRLWRASRVDRSEK